MEGSKKYLAILFIAVSFFNASISLAQDTIVLNSGEKKAIKMVRVDKEVVFTIPPSNEYRAYYLHEVNYIKYADGTIYAIKGNEDVRDSVRKFKLAHPYFALAGGPCVPVFDGYGGQIFYAVPVNQGDNAYSGYANQGYIFSITGGVNFWNGWELTGMFSYFQNSFDAGAFETETYATFIGPSLNNQQPSGYPIDNFTVTGNYYYTNYSFLIGFSRNWESKYFRAGFSLLGGVLVTNVPAIYSDPSGGYSLNLNSETLSNFDLELGIHLDFKITRHIFIRGVAELQLSGITNGGNYQFIDNGAATSGSYAGNNQYPSSFNVSLGNLTAGLGYKF